MDRGGGERKSQREREKDRIRTVIWGRTREGKGRLFLPAVGVREEGRKEGEGEERRVAYNHGSEGATRK